MIMAKKDNIEITETRDWKLVWTLVHHPSIFNCICDAVWRAKPVGDLMEAVRGIVTNANNRVLLVFNRGKIAGCFICYALGDGDYEVHTCLMPNCRGRDAVRAGRLGQAEILAQPGAKRLISGCPENMPHTFIFAHLCGWKDAGFCEQPWKELDRSYKIKRVMLKKEDLPCH